MRTLRCLKLALLAAFLTAWGACSVRAADPEKTAPTITADQKAFDLKLRKSLFDVINHGCDLYNSGDWAGCYHLYAGALRTAAPLLDHHPQLQKYIADGLKEADTLPRADNGAFHLRKVLDKVRDDLKNEAAGPPPPGVKSLWERLGGEKGVAKIVDDWAGLAAADQKVNFSRGGKYKLDDAAVARLERHLVEQISAATGGTLKYSGRDMKEVHKDMGITNDEFDAALDDLKKALKKNEVAAVDSDALLKIVEATRREIVAPMKPPDGPQGKTLWDRLGGEKGVTKIVDELLQTVTKDPTLKFWRTPNVLPTDDQLKAIPNLREHLIDYISSKTGGPREYKGKSMKEVHAGMRITETQFEIFVEEFKTVLEHNGVKGDDLKTLMDAVTATKKDIVEAKKPDDKKPADKPATDKKTDDKGPGDK